MDYIKKEHIIIRENIKDKKELFHYLATYMVEQNKIESNKETEFEEGLWEREALSVTGVGFQVAIPHIQKDFIKEPTVIFLKSKTDIAYESLEGDSVRLVFMIAVPTIASAQHLAYLADLSRKLMDDAFRNALLESDDVNELYDLLTLQREEKNMQKEHNNIKLLAVTACPTGIAHTYMAAENIEKAAKALGYDIKVETNGSSGAENVLTQEEIKAADAIIIAADTKVNMARFHGKKLYRTTVSKGIKEPEKVIASALDAAVFESSEDSGDTSSNKATGIYANLMSGVSNMIPLVVGGGILIAISFIWGINSADPANAQFNQIAAWIKQVGDAAFGLMLPILAGYISYSIADRPGLAPGLVGGMLASTGGSGFLGALVSGFLAGYVVLGLKKLCKPLPKSLDGIKPVLLYPLLSIFFVGMVVVIGLNPIMKEVNTIITDFLNNLGGTNKVLLGLVLGMMMAADLGGPINKAAYAFSIAMLQAGNIEIMGAVMTSGMVPAVGVALAATIFKRKFNAEQRDAAKANYIMGLSFICEGAIPYAAADPKVIIPSIITGAGVTGALSMLFNVGVPAPHGGIFVLPVVENVAFFALVVIIGTIITAMMIGFLKKDIKA